MSPCGEADWPDFQDVQNLLDEPEEAGLIRMTKLVEHVFRVPIAYMALLGSGLEVVTRVGSGSEHWKYLQTYPLGEAFVKPARWPDPSGATPAGFIRGKLCFAASAPLRSSDGVDLGLLVIADVRERPDFSNKDHEILVELAGVLAGKMELRMLASRARDSELFQREAERRFRNIADAAPVMLIYSCADGAGSFVNKAWLEFTGRSIDEELGEGYADTFHPDHREVAVRQYWESFQARKSLSQEFPMRRHDGVYRWMRVRGMPRFLDDGTYVGYIGCFVDVTDQRSAISALRKQTLCLAAMAETAGAFFLILDPEGRIEQTNLGQDPTGMSGRFIWEICDGGSKGSAAVRDAFLRATLGREKAATVACCRMPGGKASTEMRWNLTPVFSEENQLLAISAVILPGEGPQRLLESV